MSAAVVRVDAVAAFRGAAVSCHRVCPSGHCGQTAMHNAMQLVDVG